MVKQVRGAEHPMGRSVVCVHEGLHGVADPELVWALPLPGADHHPLEGQPVFSAAWFFHA